VSSRHPSLRFAGTLAAVLAGALVGATSLTAQSAIQWHGYAQLRYGRADPADGFSVRRAKLWATGAIPGVDDLTFKVQGIFHNGAAGAFVLQDVFAEYRRRALSVRIGQFIPAFSLQRSQPDYLVPLVERAAAVEILVPGARTMGRDIGAQALFASPSGSARLAAGFFNGAGADRNAVGEGDFLATGRLVLAKTLGGGTRGTLGGSLAWRRTKGMDVGVLSSQAGSFAGNDVRWGVDGRLANEDWEIQGEYLHADLDGETSSGYYALGDMALTGRDELAVSVERLDTPVRTATSGGLWYVAGYTRFLGDLSPSASSGKPARDAPFPTKLMTDVRVRFDHGRARAGAAVQLQMFVH
jgi:hypothetical protein